MGKGICSFWFIFQSYFVYTLRCIIEECHQFYLSFILEGGISLEPATVLLLIVFRTQSSSSPVESNFDVLLAINDFFSRFICKFRRVSKQILEMFFPFLKYFFLAGGFYFCSQDPFTSANIISYLSASLSVFSFSLHFFLPLSLSLSLSLSLYIYIYIGVSKLAWNIYIRETNRQKESKSDL